MTNQLPTVAVGSQPVACHRTVPVARPRLEAVGTVRTGYEIHGLSRAVCPGRSTVLSTCHAAHPVTHALTTAPSRPPGSRFFPRSIPSHPLLITAIPFLNLPFRLPPTSLLCLLPALYYLPSPYRHPLPLLPTPFSYVRIRLPPPLRQSLLSSRACCSLSSSPPPAVDRSESYSVLTSAVATLTTTIPPTPRKLQSPDSLADLLRTSRVSSRERRILHRRHHCLTL